MSKSIFFFIEKDLIQDQDISLAYGPVSNEETAKYRVTSLFKTNGQAKAFAVCDGMVIIQQNVNNPDFVNLIFMPIQNIETGFTPVEYFIYRGLKKENFIVNDQIIPKDSPNKTKLTDIIWEDFEEAKEMHPEDSTDAAPNTGVIGWDFNSAENSTPLSEIFKMPRTTHAITKVSAGDYIGCFETDDNFSAGFEVVLQERFDEITLEKVRISENIIEVATPPVSGGDISEGDEPIITMRQREKILNYIDPAAYFMISSLNVISYYTSNSSAIHKFTKYDSNIVSNFFTKDIIYLDIRNENGYSINYYKDYQGKINMGDPDFGKNIKISFNSGVSYEAVKYYIDYWPVYTFSATKTAQSAKIDLAIRLDYNPKAYIYFDLALEAGDSSYEQISGADKFKDLINLAPSAPWSYPVELGIPAFAWYNKLYVGRNSYDIDDLPATSLKKQHYLDFIFGPISSVSDTPLTGFGSKWHTVTGKKLISAIPALGFNAAVEVTILETSSLIQFYIHVIDSIRRIQTISVLSPDMVVTGDIFPPEGKSTEQETIFADNTRIVFRQKNTAISNVTIETFSVSDESDYKPVMCCLTITRSEYDNYIKNALSNVDPSVHDATLNIAAVEGTVPETESCLTQVTGADGLTYYKGRLKIHGLSSAGTHAVDSPASNIEIVTLDGRFFKSTNAELSNENMLENATDPNAYIVVDDAIEYIKTVEECYYDIKLPISIPDTHIGETCTRIRVHSYGSYAKPRGFFISSELQEKALENLVIDAPYHLLRKNNGE